MPPPLTPCIGAINNIREQLQIVIFVWAPAHAGVACNAYADAVAKAASQLGKKHTGQDIAPNVTSRAVIYERPINGETEIINEPCFAATRKDTMEWIRDQHNWEALPGTQINQTVARYISKGKEPRSEDEENTHQAPTADILRERARITTGMRAQRISGGPQHESDFLKYAANNTGSFSAHAIRGGCRGCQSKGWPGKPETNAHCFLCCTIQGRELSEWRTTTIGILRSLHDLIRQFGTLADDVLDMVKAAIHGVARPHYNTQQNWQALRSIVGGIIPQWTGTPPPNLDERVATHIHTLQSLFSQRLLNWSKHMAPRGTKRQQGWNHSNWLKLIIRAWKHTTIFNRYFQTPEPPTCTTQTTSLKDYCKATRNKCVHLHACARAYITYVLLPERQEEGLHNRASSYKKEMSGKLKFWIRFALRELQHRRLITIKQQHRMGKISSRTRGIGQKDRKNLSEYKWTCQRIVTVNTKYEGLHRWPHRDKIGRQLQSYIKYITTLTWPDRVKRKKGITLTPEDCSQESSPSQDKNLETDSLHPPSTPPRKKPRIPKSSPTLTTPTPTLDDQTPDDRTLRLQRRRLLLHSTPSTSTNKKPRMLMELQEDTTYANVTPNITPTLKRPRMLKEITEDRIDRVPDTETKKGKN